MAVILLLASLAAGCGLTSNQRAALKTFGAGAAQYGTATAEAAPKAKDAAYRLRADSLGYPTKQSRRAFFKAVADLPRSLNNAKAREHAELVVAVATAIGDYGEALSEYAKAGESDDRADRFTSVAQNFDAILGSPIAKGTAGTVGQVVEFATTQVIEAVKRRKLVAIVKAYRPAIEGASKLLEAEFKGETAGTLVFAYRQELGVLKDRIPSVPSESGGFVSAGLDDDGGDGPAMADADKRRSFIDVQLSIFQHGEVVDALSKQGVDATRDLLAAQIDLEAVLEHPELSWERISTFAQSVGRLYAAFKSSE